MVKVGFIVEGETEKILLDSCGFSSWCAEHRIEIVSPVIDAGGSGNLLPQNIGNYIAQIRKASPAKICVLTDLECNPTTNDVRKRILTDATSGALDVVFIAVKAVEAWFLADGVALTKWLKQKSPVLIDKPEETAEMPWLRLKELAREHSARGPGSSKPNFAKTFTKHCGFSLQRAASHPHCPSAKEFHDTLLAWANTNKT